MNSENKKKRVALYIRVSTTEQGEKYGPKFQEDDMIKWVKGRSDTFEPVQKKFIYRDIGCSGTTDIEEREGLSKLFEDAEKNKFDVVLVWKLDRFFRKTLLLLQGVERLEKYKVGFKSTKESDIDTTSSMGKVVLTLLGALAEMERNNIVERGAAGKQAAAKAGKWVGGKHPPYGYKINPTTQKMRVHKEEAEIVRKIFDWFVNERLTTYEIQDRMNQMNIPTKSDEKENELKKAGKLKKSFRTKNEQNFWSNSTIRKILNQDAYTGTYYYGKRTKKKDPITKKMKEVPNPREKWIPITCPWIIDKTLHQKAKKLLIENEALSKRNAKNEYLLSGKVFCGVCDSSYSGYTKKKFKQENGVRKVIGEYANYRCLKSNKSKTDTICENRQISGTILEDYVWGQTLELFSDPKAFVKKVETKMKDKLDIKKLEKDKEIYEKKIQELAGEAQRAISLFEKGLAYQNDNEIENRMKEIEREKELVSSRIDVICSQILTQEQRRDRIVSIKNLAKKYEKTLENLDFEAKKRIIQAVLNRVVIFEDKVRIEFIIEKTPSNKGGSSNSGEMSNVGTLETPYGGMGEI